MYHFISASQRVIPDTFGIFGNLQTPLAIKIKFCESEQCMKHIKCAKFPFKPLLQPHYSNGENREWSNLKTQIESHSLLAGVKAVEWESACVQYPVCFMIPSPGVQRKQTDHLAEGRGYTLWGPHSHFHYIYTAQLTVLAYQIYMRWELNYKFNQLCLFLSISCGTSACKIINMWWKRKL